MLKLAHSLARTINNQTLNTNTFLRAHTLFHSLPFSLSLSISPVRSHWLGWRWKFGPASLLLVIILHLVLAQLSSFYRLGYPTIIRTQSLFVSPFPEHFCLRMMTSDATHDTFWYSGTAAREFRMVRCVCIIHIYFFFLHIFFSSFYFPLAPYHLISSFGLPFA